MADTLEAVYLTTEWQDVPTLTGDAILDGEAITIQNQSWRGNDAAITISNTKPADNFRGWVIPAVKEYPAMVTEGENKVWLRANNGYSRTLVSIQKL